jgi:hypothetical protein
VQQDHPEERIRLRVGDDQLVGAPDAAAGPRLVGVLLEAEEPAELWILAERARARRGVLGAQPTQDEPVALEALGQLDRAHSSSS